MTDGGTVFLDIALRATLFWQKPLEDDSGYPGYQDAIMPADMRVQNMGSFAVDLIQQF